jgi:hypothetical protein
MVAPTRIEGETQFAGDVVMLAGVTMPSGVITNAHVAAGAAIAATKLQHQFPIHLSTAGGTAVTAVTNIVHIARGAGTVVSVEAALATVPTGTGTDKTVTIDVQKSTGGAAFATLLSSTIVLDSGNTDRVAEAGTLAATPTYADGDLIQIVVTVSGSTGTQGTGLIVTAFVQEATA